MSLAQGNNTPTRPRIEPGSPDQESDALTTRPVRSPLPYHDLSLLQYIFTMSALIARAQENPGLEKNGATNAPLNTNYYSQDYWKTLKSFIKRSQTSSIPPLYRENVYVADTNEKANNQC